MDKLNILWTSDSRGTFMNMVAMYAINSKRKGWWKNVNVLIWGASAQLAATDSDVQAELREMLREGVTVEACKACADNLDAADTLSALGITVRYTGESLTEYIKAGEKVLSV